MSLELTLASRGKHSNEKTKPECVSRTHWWHFTQVEVRGQYVGDNSLLCSCGSQVRGHQPSHWLGASFLIPPVSAQNLISLMYQLLCCPDSPDRILSVLPKPGGLASLLGSNLRPLTQYLRRTVTEDRPMGSRELCAVAVRPAGCIAQSTLRASPWEMISRGSGVPESGIHLTVSSP